MAGAANAALHKTPAQAYQEQYQAQQAALAAQRAQKLANVAAMRAKAAHAEQEKQRHREEQRAEHIAAIGSVDQPLAPGLAAQPGDIFISTFPKSGTTWMQQVVCMLHGPLLRPRTRWLRA